MHDFDREDALVAADISLVVATYETHGLPRQWTVDRLRWAREPGARLSPTWRVFSELRLAEIYRKAGSTAWYSDRELTTYGRACFGSAQYFLNTAMARSNAADVPAGLISLLLIQQAKTATDLGSLAASSSELKQGSRLSR